MSAPEGPRQVNGSRRANGSRQVDASRCAGGSGRAPGTDDDGAAARSTGLDLARLLIRDPRRTLLLRVSGESMLGAGIRHGDLLVVERRWQAGSGAIVVARLGERFTLKRLRRRGGRCWLEAAHPAYPALDLEAVARRQGLTAAEVEVWGVAVHVIRTL